jgi:saccharopine dehydrogenase (NAD+, L-lysine forming)
MAKVMVLGGCGAVGSVAVKTLAAQDMFSNVVIGDRNISRARALASEIGKSKVTALEIDVEDPASLKEAIKGSDVVLNCVGPFYRSVKTIVDVVLDMGINYVDVCDDVDVTLDLLDMDAQAKARGVTALIGMGSSPGATNLLAKFAYGSLLDETDSIDIFHTHGGEAFEGEGVIGHRFHCMSIDIPMYLDGKLTYVKFFEEDGIALRQTFDFPMVGKGIPIFPYPHPEQVTLPRHMKVRNVTNKGSVLPIEYYNLTKDLCALGLSSLDPVMVKGVGVVPHDFTVAYIIRKREEILKATGFGKPCGCCSVVARGRKEGKYQEYRFHMASRTEALGEGTGIPAAMGVMLMVMGKVSGPGILPPEACVDPSDFIGLITKVMNLGDKKKESDSFSGVIVERIDENGNVENLDI